MNMPVLKRGKNVREAVRDYINDRIQIAKNTAKRIESRIRTGEPTIIRPDLVVVALTDEFGSTTKKERSKAIRKMVGKIFPAYKDFETRRLIK
jgi:hypothetical protein